MSRKNKLSLLAISAVALSVTQAAHAQVIGNLGFDGTVLAPNGGNTCADGVTAGGYTTIDGSTNLGNVTVSGDEVAQTLCGNFDATNSYSTFAFAPTLVNGDAATLLETGSATSTFEYAVEYTDVSDTSTLPPTFLYSDQAGAPISVESVGGYSFYEELATDQQNLFAQTTQVSGTGTTGTGSSSYGHVTPVFTYRSATSGTSTFDPVTGDITYTPTAGLEGYQDVALTYHTQFDITAGTASYAQMTANGFQTGNNTGSAASMTAGGVTYTNGTNTVVLGTNPDGGVGLSNGPSYVTINQDNVTIHGGTTSTTAVWNNSGYTQTDSTNGVTFTVDNNGNVQNLGNSTVGGNLQVNGNANVNGFTTLNGGAQINNGLTVSGNSTFNNDVTVLGSTNTNGIANTGNITNSGNITTGSLNVTGATTTNGITNTGNIATTTLTTTNNATVGGALAVAGATTTNGITNTGTITSTGSITSSGTVTGATLVSAGATSVGTNLTVGGTASIAGNTSLGGNLAVVGNYSTTSGNIVTGTGQIWAGNVRINPGNNGTISGLTNATLSATSTEAVTGQQLFATNNALSALDARERANFNLLMNRADKAYQGVAMAFATNAAPLNLDNGEGGISGGVGAFEGAWAGAVRAQYVSKSGVGVGANIGFSKDAFGGAVGASIKF